MGHSLYPHSTILVFGQSSIYSLLPSTVFAQVTSLLQSARLAEAQALLERTEADHAEGSTSSGDPETLRYLHQCLAFSFMRQTRFREATAHFVKGAIDPRVPVSYFDELRPALFREPPSHEKDGNTTSQGAEGDFVEVEIWDGIREYMPDETSIDDIIAINLVRNYSPYLRSGAIPSSQVGDAPVEANSSASDSHTKSGTRTHPATIAMGEGLRGEATEMVKSVLAAVVENAAMWSRDIIEITSTALALLYTYAGDIPSLFALFTPLPPTPLDTFSRPVSRSSSRPPSRPGSTSHVHSSNGYPTSIPSHTRHISYPSQTLPPSPPRPASFRPEILEPVLSQKDLWGALLEMWKVYGDAEKVVDILVGLTEGTHVDSSVVDPLGQIFSILAPTRTDPSLAVVGVSLSLSESKRYSLVKKWAAWLAGKDVERGLKLLTSSQVMRHRRPTGPTGATSRGRDRADRERDTRRADELVILSDLRNTNAFAAKRYLEWLVIGRGLGRGGKETTEEEGLFEELVWSGLEEVLEYVANEGVRKLWKAKVVSYASSPSTSAVTSSPSPPPSASDVPPSPTPPSSQPSPRSPFLSYFSSTTPDSPSKHARIKTMLLLQSIREGKKLVKDIQDRITNGGWDKILGLEMAILHSKIPSAQTTLKTLYALRDTSTAESYASSCGLTGVISTKIGVSAAEGCGLSDWGGWFARGSGTTEVEGGTRHDDMLKILLEVYMEDGDTQQTARFLSSQAKRLDVLDIFPLVPSNWPLCTLSAYLTRSLRRTQHTAQEGQIVKAICSGQNLAVLESTFETLREEGAFVEEAVSDDEEDKRREDGVGRSFDEKVVLHGATEGTVRVVNVHAESGGT